MSCIIEVKNVSKIYRMGDEKISALSNINLSMEKGKFYCLLGTSGSGKSTLLHLLAGLEKPSKGEIRIKNAMIHKLKENQLAKFRQMNIGFVFQSYNLLPMLTAMENVSIPLTFKGVNRKLRDKKAASLLRAVGLGDRLKHKPSQMSGGQQQRVSIARAFIGNPEIIFADEPTGNLDTKTSQEVMELITSMAKENNQTLVIVTHDVEISKYADRVIYIRDGSIEKIVDNLEKEGALS
ncbi:ABC transporter ATP-binding protein [Alkaliphilus serpentinus]|uniref:ABC transporter ATP-binding protein n=1 Tax=Alkaliphilus serpentinus TaxID=1482731 RepID=A0A833HP57_9FIRM|nr:ABC transporter ATP-binding protein [Alkaliphilus serpentinus]KAB3530319.1 ABC transporter ATP-binding protein [Alkaliphilus serpentinus]